MDTRQRQRRRRRRAGRQRVRVASAAALAGPGALGSSLLKPVDRIVLCIVAVVGCTYWGAWLLALMRDTPPFSGLLPRLDTPAGITVHYLLFLGLEAGLILLFWRLLDRRSLEELGLAWRASSAKRLALGAVCGAAAAAASALVSSAQGYPRGDMLAYAELEVVFGLVANALVVFVIVAVVEEMVFRGYLLANLQQLTDARLAAVLCSILFALYHFTHPDGIHPLNQLSWFLGGITLVLLRLATGSLWTSIGQHFTFNFVLWLLMPDPTFLPGVLQDAETGPISEEAYPSTVGWTGLAAQLLEVGLIWRFIYLPAQRRHDALYCI